LNTHSIACHLTQQDLLCRECAVAAPSGEAGPSGDNLRHQHHQPDESDDDQPHNAHFLTLQHSGFQQCYDPGNQRSCFEQDDYSAENEVIIHEQIHREVTSIAAQLAHFLPLQCSGFEQDHNLQNERSGLQQDDDSRNERSAFEQDDDFRNFFMEDMPVWDEQEQHAIVQSPQNQLIIHEQIHPEVTNSAVQLSAPNLGAERSPEQQQRTRERTRSRVQRHRDQQHVQLGAALDHTESLMSGTIVVPLFRLGQRQPCNHCGALLFPHEKSWGHMCCMKGQVVLPALEEEINLPNVGAAQLQQQNAAQINLQPLEERERHCAHNA